MYKSEQEINQIFSDHLDSLKISGLPYSETEIRLAWDEALEDFRNR